MEAMIIVDDPLADCPSCDRRGYHTYYIPIEKRIPDSPESVLIACGTCYGLGFVEKEVTYV